MVASAGGDGLVRVWAAAALLSGRGGKGAAAAAAARLEVGDVMMQTCRYNKFRMMCKFRVVLQCVVVRYRVSPAIRFRAISRDDVRMRCDAAWARCV